jgi:hypothetical protein
MSKPSDEKAPASFGLSDQGRNNIVVSFIMAYLDQKVTVDFPTPATMRRDQEFLDALRSKLGVNVEQWTTTDLELAVKDYFMTRFKMAAGSPATAPEEKRKAVNELFDFIAYLRIGDNIKGEFIGVATLESKLADLEEKVAKHDESLGELRLIIRTLLGGGVGGGTSQ